MSLARYNSKRDFSRTREPKGERRATKRKTSAATAGDALSFVVQKHDARRLHYDFRLELDGVLLSWAVTRGPSLVPADKRLAVHVEDHPLAYGGFEGTIPKGEYGGGTVILWDRGTWTPVGDPKRGLAKGHLEFTLDGEKLSGLWHLVRIKGREGEKRENWLLMKAEDACARTADAPDILEERPESVASGRLIADVEQEAPGWSSKTGPIPKGARARAPSPATAKRTATKRKAAPGKATSRKSPEALPDMPLMLATRVKTAPSGEAWVHEIKFDGYRLQPRLLDRTATLLTRGGLDWTSRFGPAIREALIGLPAESAILDGEVVVEGSGGASDFSALQADLSAGRTDQFVLYLFDLLYLDGEDLRPLPLSARKARLEALLADAPPVLRLSATFEEEGAMVLRHACRLSLEGVISKKRAAPYRDGRSRDWVKSRCAERQELVVCGFVPSTTGRDAIGSLVMGYYEDGALVHAGRVGTGYSQTVAHDLMERLRPLRRKTSPFKARLPAEAARDVAFVAPELVAEVEFRGWTGDGHLRHAAFRGLREDKPAKDVAREARAEAPKLPRSNVRLTHPDRIYWPDAGVTKAGLADYYAQVWRWMAPFVVNRPLALLRCPEGIEGQCFFQKHAWRGASKAIRLVSDPKDADGAALLSILDLDGLIGLVQAGVLEIHPWGATLEAIEQPDQMIFDLDPGAGVSWQDIIAAAHEVRDRLSALGLASFVKTSGGKGLHVVAPLRPGADWGAVKPFTKALADDMARDAPDRFVATISKAKRTGRILVDYLRNGRGNTAVAPYSTRARPGAAVSMPLDWSELTPEIGPDYFTVLNAPARLAAQARDPWADFRAAAAPLPAGKGRGKRAR